MIKRILLMVLIATTAAASVVLEICDDGTVRTWPTTSGYDPFAGKTVVNNTEIKLSITSTNIYLDTSKYYIDNVLYSAAGWMPSTNWLAQWLNDVDSTNAVAEVGEDGVYVGSSCKQFNGLGDYIDFGNVTLGESFNITVTIKFDSSAASYTKILSNSSTSASAPGEFTFGRYSTVNDVILVIYPNGAARTVITGCGNPFDGNWHTFEIIYSVNSYTIKMDGNTTQSGTIAGATGMLESKKLLLGTSPTVFGQYYIGGLSYLSISGLGEYTFASGPSAIEYDISGSGNHGTYTTSDANAMAVTSDAVMPWNIVNGCSVWTNATTTNYIPYMTGTTTPVTNSVAGMALMYDTGATNVVHNGAEQSLIWYGGTNTYSELLALGPITNGPIENILIYTNSVADTNSLNTWCEENGGVWTNTYTAPPVASATYPDLYVYEPTNATFAAFASFNPPTNATTPDVLAPITYEYTPVAGAGESIILTGTNIASDYVVYAAGYTNTISTTNTFADSAVVTMPEDLPAGLALLWPTNASGAGYPLVLNRSDGWKAMPPTVATNETFSIIGRWTPGTNGHAYAYCSETGDKLEGTFVDANRADFVIPADYANGTYTFWPYGGGGKYGWSRSGQTITVADKVVWSGGTYDVTDYGAVGDGTTDDSAAIIAAITAAQSDPYSTVYLPNTNAGVYAMARSVHDFHDMRLLGDGTNGTTITFHDSYGTNGSYKSGLFYQFHDNVKFEGIRFAGNSEITNSATTSIIAANVKTGPFWIENCCFDDRAYAQAGAFVSFENSDDVRIKDSTFYLAGYVGVEHMDFAGFSNCVFRGHHDSLHLVNVSGTDSSIMEAADVRNLDMGDTNGWCDTRFFYARNVDEGTHNVYFGQNQMIDFTPRDDAQSRGLGENVLFENGWTVFEGPPSSVSGLTNVTFSGLDTNYVGELAQIVSGTGYGQSAAIVAYDSGTITVDPPWRVAPDTNSMMRIGRDAYHVAIVNNTFDGYSTNYLTAQCGVSFFQGAYDCSIVSNTFDTCYGAFTFWPQVANQYGTQRNSSDYFNDFRYNTITNCYDGISIQYNDWGNDAETDTKILVGNVIEGNVIGGISLYGISFKKENTFADQGEFDTTVIAGNTWDGTGTTPYYNPQWATGTVNSPIETNKIVYVGNSWQ